MMKSKLQHSYINMLQEVMVIPAVIFVLSVVWMQLVKGRTSEESQKEQTKRDINFEEAYQVSLVS